MNMRAFYIILSVAVSGTASFFGSDLLSGNNEANTILITMFTVFAGFLVAVMVIIGDPAMLPEGSWRAAENRRSIIDRKLMRHEMLFWIYLIVIGLIFFLTVMKDAKSENAEMIKNAVQYVYFFLAVFSFMLTLALPKMVSDIQRARVDAVIKNRRRKAGIID